MDRRAFLAATAAAAVASLPWRTASGQDGWRTFEVTTRIDIQFFAAGIGWVPVDPADVRKVVLEEPPGNLAMHDPKVAAARQRLFGSWEMRELKA